MITEENKRCVFETLDAIRESGEMNVFGTPQWLVKNGFVENKNRFVENKSNLLETIIQAN